MTESIGAFVLNDAIIIRQKWLFNNLQTLKDSLRRTYPRAQISYTKVDPEASDKETTINVSINNVLAYQIWWERSLIINRTMKLS